MSVPLSLAPTFAEQISASPRALYGMWVCSGSPLVAEICAGSGLDWLLIDMEHSTNGLESTLAQLQAVAAYDATPLVRVPANDDVVLKQVLDLGAQNVVVPMVDTAQAAEAAVRAVRYPPRGVRGVGSALSRAARWNRIPSYLGHAFETISLTVQIETVAAVENFSEIAGVDGIDLLFVGPSDLAASMGFLGQQEHPDVVKVVERCIEAAAQLGIPIGVNAFTPATAERYVAAGASFVLVGADVTLLARGSEALTDRYLPTEGTQT